MSVVLDRVKLDIEQAAVAARHCELTDAAREFLHEDISSRAFLGALMEAGLRRDAVRLLAFALPTGIAVEWAIRCARAGVEPTAQEAAALDAAERWLTTGSEGARRSAMLAAEQLRFATAAAWAGCAAFWSGDNIAPQGLAARIAPQPHLRGLAVAGAVLLAAVRDPLHMERLLVQFLDDGLALAAGAGGPGNSGPGEQR